MGLLCTKWLDGIGSIISSAERHDGALGAGATAPDRLPPRRGGRPSPETASAAPQAGLARLGAAPRALSLVHALLATLALLPPPGSPSGTTASAPTRRAWCIAPLRAVAGLALLLLAPVRMLKDIAQNV